MEEDIKLTRQQQKAIFLWLGQCAEVLREQGLDLRKALIAPVIPTKNSLKEMVFTPIMQSMFGHTSTTELLKRNEIDEICDVIRATFSDMKIVLPPFPSLEEESFNNLNSSTPKKLPEERQWMIG
jgi:hypothetical protein